MGMVIDVYGYFSLFSPSRLLFWIWSSAIVLKYGFEDLRSSLRLNLISRGFGHFEYHVYMLSEMGCNGYEKK